MKVKNQPKSLLDVMTPEDRAVAEARAELRESRAEKISNEYMALAEFGYYFGWQAVRDVLDDYITLDQMYEFNKGGRIMKAQDVYESAIAHISSNVKKVKDFEKMMKPFTDKIASVE